MIDFHNTHASALTLIHTHARRKKPPQAMVLLMVSNDTENEREKIKLL